jgi:mannosylglycerate hydrolase
MHTLHLVSHTHWDREWYQTFQQFRLRLVRLVDNLLDILAADPHYKHFMLDGQTIVLEDYLAMRPGREEELRRYIQEGRILIGPWYLLPDEFLVSPEATIRNLLEGDRITRQFGPKMMVGYIPDPFGHIGQMPQILRGFGIQNASVMRGLADEPCEFWWESPDGSRVLMAYLRNGYGNAAGILSSHQENFVSEANKICADLAPHAVASHLLFMHGTDHMEPQPGTSAAVTFAENRLVDAQMIHSTLPAYFAAIQAELDLEKLPVVTGELRSSKRHPLLPNVLSTRIWIKQRNHACETLLEKWAEPFNVWAVWSTGDKRSPVLLGNSHEIIHQAWRLLMQCHPHDSICGCSIDQVHEEMRSRFDQVEQIGEEITRQSLVTLAEVIDTYHNQAADLGEETEVALVVFNPTDGPRNDLVSVALEAPLKNGALELVDDHGAAVPFQTIGLGSSDLINMVMGPKELSESMEMVADGVVMGWKVRDMQLRRKGNEAFIEMAMVENGAANLEVWEQGKQAVKEYMDDPTITTYIVHAHTAETTRLLFSAVDVPGYGFRSFWVRGKPRVKVPPVRLSRFARVLLPLTAKLASSPVGQKMITMLTRDPSSRPPYRIENEFLRVEAQPDGTLDILDKSTGVLYQGQNRLVDGGDRGDEYNYSPPTADLLLTARLKRVQIELGSVQQTLKIRLELHLPEGLVPDRKSRSAKKVLLPVTCLVSLIKGVPRVDIHTEVENNACDHRLRVHFTAPFSAKTAEHDGHFEIVQRPAGVPAFDAQWIEQPRPETCQRAFSMVTEGEKGLLVANRGLPEVEVCKDGNGNAEIAITLLRCVGWFSRDDFPERKGHAGPGLPTPGAQMQGKWAFDYSLIPFAAKDRLAAIAQAYAFQAPLRATCTGLHAGILPTSGTFLNVEPREFVISAIKQAEDGQGWLVRGYNLSDQARSVTLQTLRPFASVVRLNMAEECQEALHSDDCHIVDFQAKGHEVCSILFREG